MKASEYRAMDNEQLELNLREVQKNLFHLRFQSATERLETPSEILKAKREIARILTIRRERELEELALQEEMNEEQAAQTAGEAEE